MIKKLHYVWLGGKPLPRAVQYCIGTWKRHCPDWEIIQWNETNFPVQEYRWVNEAIEAKKFAFAADFIRLWALDKFGGGYCDTDVTFLRPIENSIVSAFVCGIENFLSAYESQYMTLDGTDRRTHSRMGKFGMQTGFFYSEPHHPFIIHCMKEIYSNGQKPFICSDGRLEQIIIDGAMIWELKKFGFLFKDKTQKIHPDITIYDSSVFAINSSRNRDTFVIHWYDQSWNGKMGLKERIKRFIKQYFYFIYRR